jgi:hypothetical protein
VVRVSEFLDTMSAVPKTHPIREMLHLLVPRTEIQKALDAASKAESESRNQTPTKRTEKEPNDSPQRRKSIPRAPTTPGRALNIAPITPTSPNSVNENIALVKKCLLSGSGMKNGANLRYDSLRLDIELLDEKGKPVLGTFLCLYLINSLPICFSSVLPSNII